MLPQYKSTKQLRSQSKKMSGGLQEVNGVLETYEGLRKWRMVNVLTSKKGRVESTVFH
jgi:hypothetical protein